mmetsp:Transcript_8462/g.12622  ORF Transcript_8462/g.12622 Transcript_8462/m.12622 type:complete len:151 (-) Transcript_8462:163-615(-)
MPVRCATIDDIEKLSHLFDCYRVFYRQESDITAAKQFLLDRINQNDSVIYVAESEIDNNIVGFTQLYPLFSSVRLKRLWQLNDLYVDINYRQQGFAVALIEQAKSLANNTNSCGLFLETEKTNDVGNRLYPKTGFVYDDECNYYHWSPTV